MNLAVVLLGLLALTSAHVYFREDFSDASTFLMSCHGFLISQTGNPVGCILNTALPPREEKWACLLENTTPTKLLKEVLG